MKPQQGKRYKLRNGTITQPIEKNTYPHSLYKFVAWVREFGGWSKHEWLSSGERYRNDIECDYDIVEEVA